ncbi:unnamed protein product [Paramecium pentaurelia]|uniref:Uncharacterized protein n=1 Tax=Paramecium pentaurelia TaxID=43138 RepID=A0A8S1XWL7_9CILI|nr:unnamed protein product [Paramecium pentaurelia]
MDVMVVWKYNFNNQDNKQQHNNNGFRVFVFGLSYDLKYLAVAEKIISSQHNPYRVKQVYQQFYFRIKLFETKLSTIIIESSLQHIDFYYINFIFSRDSNFLFWQGSWDSYLIIDIQKKKNTSLKIFQKENHFLFFKWKQLKVYIYGKMRKYFMSIQSRSICNKKKKFILNSILICYISNHFYQTQNYTNIQFILEIVKLLHQEKYKLMIDYNKSFLKTTLQLKKRIYKEQNVLSSGKLVRRIKNLFGNSGYVYQDEHGIYKHVIFNIENPINHYQIKIFDFSRGTFKEISYQIKSKYNNNLQISRFFNQFIYTSTSNGLQNQITCYTLR